jgi:CheY-like chemotaxis protein
LNLLVNAAQAMPEGHASENRILIKTSAAGSQVEVMIEDTGAGMTKDVSSRIGEPFFSTKPDGMGLGLAVCQSILAQIGGALRIESEPGKTVARVLLAPGAAASDREQRAPPSKAPASDRRARILIVDDEALVARAISRHLRDHDVRIARSGREALEIIDSGEYFDLILCDVMMPDLSGMDVYSAVEQRHPDLRKRIVFMTGATFTDRALEFCSAVPNTVLPKPLETTRVLDILDELGRARQ